MSKQITILENQRVIDIAMQELGDVEMIFDLALLNGVSVTDDLSAGTLFTVPDFDKTKRATVNLFLKKGVEPASADATITRPSLPPGGIGFMQIANDFKVS